MTRYRLQILACLVTLAVWGCSDAPDTEPTPGEGDTAEDPAGETRQRGEAPPDAPPPPAGSEEPEPTDFPQATIEGDPATGFTINSDSVPTHPGKVMGGINAFCEPADQGHVRYGANVSPDLYWDLIPDGTASFAVIVHDPDAPKDAAAVNREGTSVPKSAPRADFHHWVLVDIPPGTKKLPEGAGGKEVVEGGKAPSKTEWGVAGVNDFTTWFAGDEAMKGTYAHYDGPCPPWNDDLPHRYVHTVYALDVPTLGLSGAFTAPDALAKMEGHVLAKASLTGIYWVNAAIQPPQSP